MINLYENEKIILKKRKHWYAIASQSLVLFFAALIPIATILLALTNDQAQLIIRQFMPLVIFGISAWLILLWTIFFVLWTNYYLDIFLLTNYRVVDIEQHGLFARDMAEIRYDRIQDVTIEVFGVLPSLLGFGNIHIQTAGRQREVVVRHIPRPDGIREVLSEQIHRISGENSNNQ